MVVSPVLGCKSLKNVVLKGRQIISLAAEPPSYSNSLGAHKVLAWPWSPQVLDGRGAHKLLAWSWSPQVISLAVEHTSY